jgi:hypothetical protein
MFIHLCVIRLMDAGSIRGLVPKTHCPAPLRQQAVMYGIVHCIFVYGMYEVHPVTGRGGPEWEEMYSCTLSLTSALDGARWSTLLPGRFTPGIETPYALYRGLGAAQGRSGRVRNIWPHGMRCSDRPAPSESLSSPSYGLYSKVNSGSIATIKILPIIYIYIFHF